MGIRWEGEQVFLVFGLTIRHVGLCIGFGKDVVMGGNGEDCLVSDSHRMETGKTGNG